MELFLVYLAVAVVFFVYFFYDKLKTFNPFIKEYYLAKERIVTIATGTEEAIHHNFANYLDILMKDRNSMFKVNVTDVATNAESIVQTNVGNTDYGIASEYALSNSNVENMRYVCSLYDANVLILSDDRNTQLFDFSDFVKLSLRFGIVSASNILDPKTSLG